MTSNESERIKSFLDDIQKSGHQQACIMEAAAGVTIVRNPGGKDTKKKCTLCRQEGHRRAQCPNKQDIDTTTQEAVEAEEAARFAHNPFTDEKEEEDEPIKKRKRAREATSSSKQGEKVHIDGRGSDEQV